VFLRRRSPYHQPAIARRFRFAIQRHDGDIGAFELRVVHVAFHDRPIEQVPPSGRQAVVAHVPALVQFAADGRSLAGSEGFGAFLQRRGLGRKSIRVHGVDVGFVMAPIGLASIFTFVPFGPSTCDSRISRT
jgi:hypothetical protein